MIVYVDASYDNEGGYKSRSEFGFLVGNSLVSWLSQKQSVIAQSDAESEYYAAVSASNGDLWLKQLSQVLGKSQGKIKLYKDNQACIALTKNPEDHKKDKTH